MSIYYLIDLLLAVLIGFLTFISYKKRIYLKTFEYLKIFIFITLAASFAPNTGIFLQKEHILSGDTYSVLVLIGFGANIGVLLFLYLLLRWVFKNFITSTAVKTFFAKSVTFLQVVFVVTFSLYIIMQLHLSKRYLNTSMHKSLSYPYIKSFYLSFINDDFVNMIIYSNTKNSPHEVIINSLKNELN